MDCFEEYELNGNKSGCDAESLLTCDDAESQPESCISYYLHGYVAHKLLKLTKCELCRCSLVDSSDGVRPNESVNKSATCLQTGQEETQQTVQVDRSIASCRAKCIYLHREVSVTSVHQVDFCSM